MFAWLMVMMLISALLLSLDPRPSLPVHLSMAAHGVAAIGAMVGVWL